MLFSPAGADDAGAAQRCSSRPWSATGASAVARRDGRRALEGLHALRAALRSSRCVRLGQPRARARAARLLLARPAPGGWNQWAEVVGTRARAAALPRRHAACVDLVGLHPLGARPVRLRARCRRCAGARRRRAARVARTGPVEVQGLRTAYGKLDFELERDGAEWAAPRRRCGTRAPPGGLWFAWPGSGEPPASTVDGAALQWQGKLLRLPDAGADLRFQLSAADAAR